MEQINFAAIDIGSNAVRLLIKGIYKGETANQLKKTFIVRVPLRVGQDAFTLGRISNDKTERLLRLIAAFKQMMQVYRVISYRACATSAMRDASNGSEVVRYISEQTGIKIDIIDGKEVALEYPDISIIGSGGNIRKIDKLTGTTKGEPLSLESLYQVSNMLQALPIKERMKQYDLKPDRADVIVPAAELFIQITRHLNCKSIWVPTIGIADGITYSLCSDYLNTHN